MRLRSKPSRSGRRGSRWGRIPWILLGLAILVAYTSAVFSAGLGYYKLILPALRNLTGADTPASALAALAHSPANYLRARLSPPHVEHIEIDIKFKHLNKIYEKRSDALQRGVLLSSSDDFVPAEIRHDGRRVRVKLRLKGDQPDHWRTDKLSFRIHVKGGDQLFGMRRFSIQAPVTRGYHLEPLFHDHLRREGVLSPRYFFVDVTLNGKDIGLMALEEHPSKELLESQQRRDGVIVHFDETLFWQNVVLTTQPGTFHNVETSFLRPFEDGRIEKSEALRAQWEVAAGLLEGFMHGKLAASEVFDLELMARFMAVAEVWRAPHSLTWINRRFYLNPLTLRLEPVGYDGNLHAQYRDPGLANLAVDFSKRLFADEAFVRVFVRELRRISREMADGTIRSELEPAERKYLRIVHRETPTLAPVDFARFEEWARAKTVIDEENFAQFGPTIGSPNLELPSPVVGRLQHGADGPYLEVTNTLPLEVTIESLRFRDGAGAKGPELGSKARARLPLTLGPTFAHSPATRARIPYTGSPDGFDAIEGSVHVRGQDRHYAFVATAYPDPLLANPLPDGDLGELLAANPFLVRDPGTSDLHVRPGTWTVPRTLILPQGTGLTLEGGTHLRFASDAGLIARGPLRFAGTEREPVVLTGIGDGPWPGIFVVESEAPSQWSHVEVRNTRGFHGSPWAPTGAVTFRRNRVSLENCRFSGNRAEDAVNVVRSEFSLVGVDFEDAVSDALDGDFTTGTIVGGRIARIGGDGIDVSGSNIEVRGVRFEDIQDKAVSVGEASRAVVRDIDVERAGTVMASKDGSRVELFDSTARSIAHVALMAYSKKPVYGGAALVASGVSVSGSRRLAVAQIGSRVVIDGTELAAEELDVDALYRGGYMQKVDLN
jgi:hypothetical protein